ncbi:Sua5/YciO/YrdC/YwlC family protein [Thermonema rossianum]|uniref:Sua5/YciO/YrdC/YwlC family protein n=1 Tax=Thermonema rossianum TaxID=55505 RepID=UPI00056EFCD2|nr:Sua5/YciO/YrdC/YwlC family protein [Thermonema rossianum]
MIETVKQLKTGNLCLYPSSLGWWLIADSWKKEATGRLMHIKGTLAQKEVVLHIESIGLLSQYVAEVPDIAWDWMEMNRRPLWVKFEQYHLLPEGVAADELWISLSKEESWHKLLNRIGHPVVGILLGDTYILDDAWNVYVPAMTLPKQRHRPDKVHLLNNGTIQSLEKGS